MKKVIISAVLLLLITACILSAGCVHDKETYTVAVDPALQPFSLMAESGELDGFDIEMMKWIAENQNFNIKFVGVTYNEYMTNVDKGNYDIRPGLIITDGRKETVDFSDPYVESHYSIVSRKDKTVTKEDVLSGNAVISVAVGSAYDVWVKNYFGEEKYNQMVKDGKILIERSVDQSILSVLAGSSDAAICADIIAVTQSDYYAPIKFIGYLDGNAQISISVKKGNEELLKKLNDGIANFKTSSRYNELKQKYRMPYLKDTYRVGVDSNNKPFTYLNEKGDLTGIDYDSIMWIADKYGFDVEFVEGNWVSNINSVFRQEIDMWYSGMTVTNERLNWVTFSDPYLAGRMVVLCPSSKIVTDETFESGNAVVGAQRGTTNEDWLISFFGKNKYKSMLENGKIVLVENQDEMYKAMKNGKIDCVVVDEVGHKEIMSERNLALVGEYENGGDYGVAMRDGNIVLINMINSGIGEMKSSGYYDTLLIKYNLN